MRSLSMCRKALVLSFVLVGLLAPLKASSEDYRIHSRSIPKGYEGKAEFFSELQFEQAAGGITFVNMADWYKLMFKRVSSQPVILRWEYMQLKGD